MRRFRPVAVSLLLAPAALGCSQARLRAHLENERGIALDGVSRHDAAESHYLRAVGYDVRPEIPLTNLGRSKTMAKAYSEAHQHFEQALLRAPDLYEAHYGDGAALYEWGESIRDPRNCEVERTLELWEQSRRRFESALELAREGADIEAASSGRDHVATRIDAIAPFAETPPPECETPPPPQPQGGGGGAEDDPNQDPSEDPRPDPEGAPEEDPPVDPSPQGAPPPGDSPPQGGGGGGGMSDDELQQVRDLLDALRGQTREPGKFYRGSEEEQFASESWENPETIIKW